MSAGRSVLQKERADIRKSYRDCLKKFSREELISTYISIPMNSPRMKSQKVLCSVYTDQQLINMILERDVEDTVKSLEKGF
jgi:hypothetical protein